MIRYGTIEAFQEYDAEIETMYMHLLLPLRPSWRLITNPRMKTKFGEKGAFDFTPIMSSRSFPPMYFTSYVSWRFQREFSLDQMLINQTQLRGAGRCLVGRLAGGRTGNWYPH